MYEVEKRVMQQSYPLVYEYYIYYGLTVVGIYIMVWLWLVFILWSDRGN